MNIIVIAVYNRIDNIKQWLHCWKQCEHDDMLIVIHNHYNEPGLKESIESLCDGITYIPRDKQGFDIGAFQDVCMARLPGFPEWDNLLWCTDDTLPMQKDFAKLFWGQLKTNGVVAMEVSPHVRKHIRTTGFAISRETAKRLVFHADQVTTKQHCYLFEHFAKDGSTFLEQVERMGLTVAMVAPQVTSPLFDFGYHRRLKQREAEHYKVFGKHNTPVVTTDKTVTIVCPIYDAYPQIISSMLCQSYTNWELWLIHDGPNELQIPDDSRIKYIQVPRKENDYGHTIRREYLQKVTTQYVLITNGDNYYMPSFLEKAIAAMAPESIASYCQQIAHNYIGYKIMNCSLQRGFIDCGQVLLRSNEAKAVGWNSTEHSADWFFFEALIKKYGAKRWMPFKGCHFVHN